MRAASHAPDMYEGAVIAMECERQDFDVELAIKIGASCASVGGAGTLA